MIVTIGAMRVTFWGALAMGLTAGVGTLFGTIACATLPEDNAHKTSGVRR
jgi:hypothetical protein